MTTKKDDIKDSEIYKDLNEFYKNVIYSNPNFNKFYAIMRLKAYKETTQKILQSPISYIKSDKKWESSLALIVMKYSFIEIIICGSARQFSLKNFTGYYFKDVLFKIKSI